jgi:hypothetical protein
MLAKVCIFLRASDASRVKVVLARLSNSNVGVTHATTESRPISPRTSMPDAMNLVHSPPART